MSNDVVYVCVYVSVCPANRNQIKLCQEQLIGAHKTKAKSHI